MGASNPQGQLWSCFLGVSAGAYLIVVLLPCPQMATFAREADSLGAWRTPERVRNIAPAVHQLLTNSLRHLHVNWHQVTKIQRRVGRTKFLPASRYFFPAGSDDTRAVPRNSVW